MDVLLYRQKAFGRCDKVKDSDIREVIKDYLGVITTRGSKSVRVSEGHVTTGAEA